MAINRIYQSRHKTMRSTVLEQVPSERVYYDIKTKS